MRKWRKNGVVAEKPKPENPCKSRKNRRRMSIYEIRNRRLALRIRHGIAEEALERFGDVAIEEREGVFVLLPEYEEEISQWINS